MATNQNVAGHGLARRIGTYFAGKLAGLAKVYHQSAFRVAFKLNRGWITVSVQGFSFWWGMRLRR